MSPRSRRAGPPFRNAPPVRDAHQPSSVQLIWYLTVYGVGLLIAYYVIRKGVHHGILDADKSRAGLERWTASAPRPSETGTPRPPRRRRIPAW